MTAHRPNRRESAYVKAADSAAPAEGPARAFPRTARLLKPTEFKKVFDQARVCSDAYFKLLARDNALAQARIGMAVSRRVDRHAVGRNRIKRVIRESFRHWRARRHTGSVATGTGREARGMDIVVLARPAAADASNEQLFQSLGRLWIRLDEMQAREANSAQAGSQVSRQASPAVRTRLPALEQAERKPDHSGSLEAGKSAKGNTNG